MKHLSAFGLGIDSPNGRPLFRDLEMRLESEQVAVVGRNGAGKTLLLDVLAGERSPQCGRVEVQGSRWLVPQLLGTCLSPAGSGASAGELRRRLLEEARCQRPDFLLLDEPSQDLDSSGIAWLAEWLSDYEDGLIIVSHDRRLLRLFRHFFVVAESGCRLFVGKFEELMIDLQHRDREANRKFASELYALEQTEHKNALIRRRRARKKAGGRVRELDRCPARACLNAKRGYAQKYHAKREGVRDQRIAAARQWARAARRALTVELPLQLPMPELPAATEPVTCLQGVSASVGSRLLFANISVTLSRERLAITGPNGAGKSTLAAILAGEAPAPDGNARVDTRRVGYIAQHGSNWSSEESLIDTLRAWSNEIGPAEIARQVVAHRFPLALAQRPLSSLSPGERVRAALICLFQRSQSVELLILDEPTNHLDLPGVVALEDVLRAWTGGLVVVSHDAEFLSRIEVHRTLRLDARAHGVGLCGASQARVDQS